jgi:peptidoglycan/xylan/chitin deacetylase (PgdA/CDA1 family)
VVLASVIVLGGALLVGAWQWDGRSDQGSGADDEGPPPAGQLDTPAPVLDAGDLATFQRFSSQHVHDLVILTYHDVRPLGGSEGTGRLSNSRYRVTPAQFAEQMAMLHAAGFHTITADDLSRYLRGGALHDRALLLTFDDGTKGTWIYADRVLERYHFHALSMVITGAVGTRQPYYLTWSELGSMARTGRWDIESHTRDGHHRIAIDSAGHTAPFLTGRAWRHDRSETIPEYTRRVQRDLAGSISDLTHHRLARPRLFAYPFSATESSARDARTSSTLRRTLGADFLATLVNVQPFQAVSHRDLVTARQLPRIEINSDTTTRALFDEIVASLPLVLDRQEPLGAPDAWTGRSGQAVPGLTFAGAEARMEPTADKKWLNALFAPGRTADWHGYRESVHVDGLGPSKSGAAGAIIALAGSPTPVVLTVSSDKASVKLGTDPRMRGLTRPLNSAPAHDVTLTVTPESVTAIVDGGELARFALSRRSRAAATGGIGLMARRREPADAPVTFTSLLVEPVTPGS